MGDISVLVTVDTEGDNEWEYTRSPKHENLEYVPEFDRMLARIGARATYLITHSVATDPRSVEILAELRERGRCEIGAHCHAWNTPPVDEPEGAQVFLNELPRAVQKRKLERLTHAIEEAFGERPVSFRGGRFGANADTLRCLAELGYRVDSTVTPGVSWRRTRGLPGGKGGPDYREAPHEPYFLSLDDIRLPGASDLLEIPVTMYRTRSIPRPVERVVSGFSHTGFVARVTKRLGLGRVLWFRPSFQTLEETLACVRLGQSRGATVYNMLIHSSELMPGGSPYGRNRPEVNALLGRTEKALEHVIKQVGAEGRTLEECREAWERRGAARSSPYVAESGVPG